MKKDIYIYPAIISIAEDGLSIEFPDFPTCLTCAYSQAEILQNAREALSLHLYGLESDEFISGTQLIPSPTNITDITLDKNQTLILIDVYMPLIRGSLDNKAVKKTITIPSWMNILALKDSINFSQVLQSALIDIFAKSKKNK